MSSQVIPDQPLYEGGWRKPNRVTDPLLPVIEYDDPTTDKEADGEDGGFSESELLALHKLVECRPPVPHPEGEVGQNSQRARLSFEGVDNAGLSFMVKARGNPRKNKYRPTDLLNEE